MGTQRVPYSSSRETIESIEAWIIQPDGTKIIVPPESIRTQDEDTGDGSSKFSDTKYKVIIFPQVHVGSRLYWKYESFVHTPLFAGQFFQDCTLSPLVRMDHWEVNITLPAGKLLYVEKRGVDGGLESRTADGDHYRFTYQQSGERSTGRGRCFGRRLCRSAARIHPPRCHWLSVGCIKPTPRLKRR